MAVFPSLPSSVSFSYNEEGKLGSASIFFGRNGPYACVSFFIRSTLNQETDGFFRPFYSTEESPARTSSSRPWPTGATVTCPDSPLLEFRLFGLSRPLGD